VLLISYPFPPVGGAGVQRAVKFVKYLERHGWLASVLTVANPSVPAFDESLADDIPENVLVRRATTWEPGYGLKKSVASVNGEMSQRLGFVGRILKPWLRWLGNTLLQPDAQVLWLPGAVREGRQLLQEIPHSAIVATGPPFSTFLIGAALSRHSGLPLLLDYRDEWSISSAYWENKQPGMVSRRVQGWMQKHVVRTARALVATSRASAKSLEAIRDEAGSTARVTWIHNGYDPEDFPPGDPFTEPTHAPYRLAYIGTLWNLTSVAPLVEAVRRLARRRPSLASDLELVFAGRRTPAQQELLAGLQGLPCRVIEHPYIDHRTAIDFIRTADGLCLLLSNVPEAGRVVPAKLFEYMAAKRPILAIAPHGEVWHLLSDYPAGHLVLPTDIDGIATSLATEIQRHRASYLTDFSGWDGSRYDRCSQAGELAELLESLQTPQEVAC